MKQLKKVEEPPDLFALLAKSPISSPSPSPNQSIERQKGSIIKERIERQGMGAEDNPAPPFIQIKRPRGRPKGTNNAFLRSRFEEQQLQLYKNTENPSALPRRAITTDDLTIPQRVARRKTEDIFTEIDEPPKSAPQRRASLSFGRRLGSPL